MSCSAAEIDASGLRQVRDGFSAFFVDKLRRIVEVQERLANTVAAPTELPRVAA
jgi:hypothetical protein